MRGSRSLFLPKGETIFHPGQACPGFVVLKEGTIKVTLAGASGREVVLYRVRPGEICLQTLSCLISGEPYGAEGVAETAIQGELVPANEFHDKFAEDGEFRNAIMSSVATRFAEYQQLVEEVALTGFDARLARVLLRMADSSDFVAKTHSALAVETASGRAYVTRRLAQFAKMGLVEQQEDGVSLRNRTQLEQLAAGER